MPDSLGRPTLAELHAEIEDDIGRADLAAQVATAVDRAIRHFQPERFFFNEGFVAFQTIPGADVYGTGDSLEIPELMAIDSAVLVENDQTTALRRVDEAWIERADDQASAAYPCAFSYFGRSLRLWPVPSDAWTIRLMAHQRLPAPALDAGNAWTDEAGSLVAAWAKRHLALNALRDPSLAKMQAGIVADEIETLRSRSNVIASTGQIQAYYL